MALALPPKPVPQLLRLHEVAARIVQLEPSLDASEVQGRLCELIASGDLPAQSEFQDDDLTWRAFRARRAGLMGWTFAETWRLWLENQGPIDWDAGTILVSGVSIPLPMVQWTDALPLFEVAAQRSPRAKAVSEAEVKRWYQGRIDTWPKGQDPPSRENDVVAARDRFRGITVAMVRKIRRDLAPESWRARGRRKPKKPAEKLANEIG
jgi:hypothetical protein